MDYAGLAACLTAGAALVAAGGGVYAIRARVRRAEALRRPPSVDEVERLWDAVSALRERVGELEVTDRLVQHDLAELRKARAKR